jgi:putative glutamine amidotransferase
MMKIDNRPLIGVILDEDTSKGGRFYQTSKGYFRAIYEAGGAPIALPYEQSSIIFAKNYCDALLSTGANIRFPDDFYISGEQSISNHSDRFAIEAQLIKIFLELDRPFLGICNGMQILGALNGAKMTFQLKSHQKGEILHNDSQTRHLVDIVKNTKLANILGEKSIITNSFHSEAILQISDNIDICAYASDGTIEAIELKNKNFAIGVQWHPELLWPNPLNDNDKINGISTQKLFESFVECAMKVSNLVGNTN